MNATRSIKPSLKKGKKVDFTVYKDGPKSGKASHSIVGVGRSPRSRQGSQRSSPSWKQQGRKGNPLRRNPKALGR